MTKFWPYAYAGEDGGGKWVGEAGLVPVGDVFRDMAAADGGSGSSGVQAVETVTEVVSTPSCASTTPTSSPTMTPSPIPSVGSDASMGDTKQGRERERERAGLGRFGVGAAVLGSLGIVVVCVAVCVAVVRARQRLARAGARDGADKDAEKGFGWEGKVLDIAWGKDTITVTRESDLSTYSALTSVSDGDSEGGLDGEGRVGVEVLLSPGVFFALSTPSVRSSLHGRTRSAPAGWGRGSEVFGHRRVSSCSCGGSVDGEVEWDVAQAYGGA